MITGWRARPAGYAAFAAVQTRIANRIRNWISDETIEDSASSLKVYKRHCVEGI